ncbi:MAG: DNA polymerase III subunit gamma/tau [Eudoraea sp.]|nr:DNA polymerase III subunit gamma/tau [Eudoraea sp.]
MEPFIVSARKYRPQDFKDVVGQEAITTTLENAIESNHLAQALLFCGPRGVGKTTCARILAKKINEDGTQKADEDFAFNIFELDAASNNSVDDIRSLTDQVRIPPQVGKYKVYIIDEVHMLSQSAFNAFLKTLEEPPAHAIFILATTEKHKIIPTILSRCQIFDFKRITIKDIASYLQYIADQQGIEADEDALHIIAQKADGAMRDALSIFDRVVSFAGKKISRKSVTENLNVLDYDFYFKATDLILENNIPDLLLLFNDILSKGFEGHHFINGLASHFRDLMVCRHDETIDLLEVGEQVKALYLEQSKKTSQEFLLKAIDLANQCDLKYKTSKNHRLLVELTLMKLASLTFEAEKKNNRSVLGLTLTNFLIPASYFFKKELDVHGGIQEQIQRKPLPERRVETLKSYEVKTSETASTQEPQPVEAITEPVPASPAKKLNIKDRRNRISGLSISGIQAKRDHEIRNQEVIADTIEVNINPYTQEELEKFWAQYAERLLKKGRPILSSNLTISTPKMTGAHGIQYTLPNHSMKKEIEMEREPLLRFLRKELRNTAITIELLVSEEEAKKYAYTPEEKYEKLKTKNPDLDLLRKTFDLEL